MASNTESDYIAANDSVKRHALVCKELSDLYKRKNHDYGDSFHLSYQEEGMAALRIRLGDKMNRFKALSKGAEQRVNDESLRDTLIDIAGYAILGVMELDIEQKEERVNE